MTLLLHTLIKMSWLFTNDLLQKIGRNSNDETRRAFYGIYPLDKLPKFIPHRPFLMIVNTHTHNLDGEHWICIFIDDSRQGELFDSLAITNNVILSQWLNRFTRRWTRNNCTYQNPLSATCGAYVLYYCLNRLKFDSFQKFLQMFNVSPLVNDTLVLDFFKTLK